MIFPTVEFAVFFAVVLPLSWLFMPHPKLWKLFILAASYFFYAYADVRFVLLLFASTAVNQAAAKLLAKRRDGRILAVALAVDLGLLGWFKYYGFFALQVDHTLAEVGLRTPLPLLQITLPVGISFFTFQAMSYVVDVWRGKIEPTNTLDFAVYESFFPHLVAGPIVRASEFLPQLSAPRDARRVPVTAAVFLIVGGLVKKVVLADLLATRLVDPVWATPGQHSSGEVLVAIYGYAVQIYCDFSAYSEMAIGLALLLGFRFPDNFNRPYAAVSLQDFWRRWHMTLSRWLRDYLYVPLGGARKGRRRTYLNLMITMVLGGLWHGAAWTFVLWGTLHGGGLGAERWWRERRGLARGGAGAVPAPSAGPMPQPRAARDPTGTGGAARAGEPSQAGEAARADTTAAPEVSSEAFRPGVSAAPAGTPGGSGAPVAASVAGVPPDGPGAASGAASWRKVVSPPVDGALAAVEDLPTAPTRRRAPGEAGGAQPNPVGRWLGRIVVFHFVCATWVLFRSPDLATAEEIFGRLFHGPGPSPLVTPTVLAAIAVGLATQAVPRAWWTRARERFAGLARGVQAAGLIAVVLLTHALVSNAGAAPFIYFRF
jgi:D-alanyl-lipoteichoic acid acyltransferase DltB (MBOAT superfamily)